MIFIYALVLLACIALVIGLYVAIIGMGVVAPSIVFALMIGLSVWQNSGWLLGIIAGVVVYAVIRRCIQYRKACKAITIFTAVFVNYFMILVMGPFFPILKGENNLPSFLGFIISLAMAAVSVLISMRRKNKTDFASEDPLWSKLLASVIYGFTAVCLVNFAITFPQGILAAIINWVLLLGVAAAHFILTEKPASFSAVVSALRQELGAAISSFTSKGE